MKQVLLEHISGHIKKVAVIGKSEHGLTKGKMVLDQLDKMTEPMIECTT